MAAAAQLEVCITTATACHFEAGFLGGFASTASTDYACVARLEQARR
jgi:predicted hydrocarbon binding protein